MFGIVVVIVFAIAVSVLYLLWQDLHAQGGLEQE